MQPGLGGAYEEPEYRVVHLRSAEDDTGCPMVRDPPREPVQGVLGAPCPLLVSRSRGNPSFTEQNYYQVI